MALSRYSGRIPSCSRGLFLGPSSTFYHPLHGNVRPCDPSLSPILPKRDESWQFLSIALLHLVHDTANFDLVSNLTRLPQHFSCSFSSSASCFLLFPRLLLGGATNKSQKSLPYPPSRSCPPNYCPYSSQLGMNSCPSNLADRTSHSDQRWNITDNTGFRSVVAVLILIPLQITPFFSSLSSIFSLKLSKRARC